MPIINHALALKLGSYGAYYARTLGSYIMAEYSMKLKQKFHIGLIDNRTIFKAYATIKLNVKMKFCSWFCALSALAILRMLKEPNSVYYILDVDGLIVLDHWTIIGL